MSGNPQVTLVPLGIDQPPFGLFDCPEYRRFARLVLVHPDSEIDLRRIWVLLEGLGETEDWISRSHFQMLEHKKVPPLYRNLYPERRDRGAPISP